MTGLAVLLIAAGGAMALEGAAWAIFPRQMREMYMTAFGEGDRFLHMTGLVSVAIGVAMIVWGVQVFGP